MGLLKWIVNSACQYKAVCKYCGKFHYGSDVETAIRHLQEDSQGCGKNCHEPLIYQNN